MSEVPRVCVVGLQKSVNSKKYWKFKISYAIHRATRRPMYIGMYMKYLILTTHDPYLNLAIEEYLFQNSRDNVFILWQNEPFFLLTLRYHGDVLTEAILNGKKIR